MLHIYRQITGLQTFQPIVFAQKRENAGRFPFEPLVVIPKPKTHELRRFWQKQIGQQPVRIYRSEARRIATELRHARAELLHIYFGHIGVHLLPLIEMHPLPIIVSFHGADAMVDMEKPRYRTAMQRMLALVSLALVRSHSLADRLVDLGCERQKIRIHRTGIPLEQLPFAQREFPADGAWRFLQACRLIPKKGLATSLRAFAAFLKNARGAAANSTFTLAGEGPMLEELRGLADALGIGANVRFPGFVSQDQLRELFYESHLFLHPSEIGVDGNQEGVPNSMLEAMATGMPVLATMHGGIPEAVENGSSGFLVPERDHGALALRTCELTSNPELFRQMSAAASKSVAKKFELHTQVRALESFYEEVLKLPPRSSSAP
jgi:colanic acid/amylovoran biosynthesis glycosyltransferase